MDEHAINSNDEKLVNTTHVKSNLNTSNKSAESSRITELEREVQHWKTEYELQKMMTTSYPSNTLVQQSNGNSNAIERESETITKTEILGRYLIISLTLFFKFKRCYFY